MVITEGAVPGGKKMPVLWETEKGRQCKEAGKDKDAGCQGIFFCDSFCSSVMSVKVVPSVNGKMDLFLCSTQRPIIIILIFTLALLLINRAIAELPGVLLCEMAD